MKRELHKTIIDNKGVLAARLLASVVLAFSGPLSLVAQANFIDAVSGIMQDTNSLGGIFVPAAFLLISYMLPMISIVLNYWLQKCNYSFELSWSRHINSLIKKIPYNQYEYEDTYNKIKQVADNNLFSSIVAYVFLLLTTGISIVSYVVILVRISPLLMMSVVILSPFVGYFSAKIADKQYKRIVSLNTYRRRGIYKSSILHDREYAKDVRVNNCADYLTDDWEKTQSEIDKAVLKIKFKYGALAALVLKTEYIVIFVNLVIVLFSFINNQISLGAFISISNQILTIKILENVKNIVTQYVDIKSNIRSYKEVIKITDGTSKPEAIDKKTAITVETKDLYFKYPHQEEYILKNINLKFELGQSYAIVGENGVGKSTLMKLLIGLYKPSSGDIFINGINLSEVSLDERSNIFGVGFQDYSKFSLSLKENILLNEGTITAENLEVLRRCEIDTIADGLQDGYDTFLGKKFGDSVDLSGGQWQNVSISRALIGEKKIFFFDEPTASLDPIKEVDTFTTINEIAEGTVRIFITHRLGITTKVDKIIMLKDGEVAEQGSFEELIKMNGLFKEMFDKQKSLYFRGNSND